MILLARFILKGYSQAALVTATAAMLGLLLPPFAYLSGASIGLVTLAGGYRQGMVVSAIAATAVAVIAVLIQLEAALAILLAALFVLLLWLPVIVAATVLRQTVSLVFCLQLVAAVSLVGILLQYQLYPEFQDRVYATLSTMADEIVAQTDGQMDRARWQDIIDRVAQPGFLASNFMLSVLLSLYIARWWQAILYNPGGFGREFQGIYLGKVTAVVALGIGTAAALAGSDMLLAMLVVMITLYLNQGLAILHAIFVGKNLNRLWLFPIYLVLLLIQPVLVLLALTGLADTWIDLRRRLIA